MVAPSRAVQRSLVSDQVFRVLCEDVLSGRYAPGELLPTQRQLAADLGVNMASVREAVKRLEQLRLVESRQGEGMRVRDWRAHGGLDVLAHLVLRAGGFDRRTLGAVLEARRLMLTEAARLAADRRSDAQARRLAEIAERLVALPEGAAATGGKGAAATGGKAAAGTGGKGAAATGGKGAAATGAGLEGAQALDFAFFNELVEASGNLVFVLITNSIRELYFEHAEAFRPLLSDLEALLPLYRRAARAIGAGDGARAAAAVKSLAEAQEVRLVVTG